MPRNTTRKRGGGAAQARHTIDATETLHELIAGQASGMHNLSKITALVNSGAANPSLMIYSVSDEDENGDENEFVHQSAIMLAAIYNLPNVLKILIKKDTPLDAQSDAGYTAVRYAVAADAFDALKLLLRHKANADIPDTLGRTPLFSAVSRLVMPSAKILLKHDADPTRRDKNGVSVIQAVGEDSSGDPNKRNEILNLLCKGYKVEDDLCDIVKVVNEGERKLPREVIRNERTGETEPIANAITYNNIHNGDEMANFDNEATSGHYYKWSTYERYIRNRNGKNPRTRGRVKTVRKYRAKF